MRNRFSTNAIASSDGTHTRVKHDRRANTTGRSDYTFCGKKVIITENNVFMHGKWIGRLFIDSDGSKYVLGPRNRGLIHSSNMF